MSHDDEKDSRLTAGFLIACADRALLSVHPCCFPSACAVIRGKLVEASVGGQFVSLESLSGAAVTTDSPYNNFVASAPTVQSSHAHLRGLMVIPPSAQKLKMRSGGRYLCHIEPRGRGQERNGVRWSASQAGSVVHMAEAANGQNVPPTRFA